MTLAANQIQREIDGCMDSWGMREWSEKTWANSLYWNVFTLSICCLRCRRFDERNCTEALNSMLTHARTSKESEYSMSEWEHWLSPRTQNILRFRLANIHVTSKICMREHEPDLFRCILKYLLLVRLFVCVCVDGLMCEIRLAKNKHTHNYSWLQIKFNLRDQIILLTVF